MKSMPQVCRKCQLPVCGSWCKNYPERIKNIKLDTGLRHKPTADIRRAKMALILMTPEGKKVAINPKADVEIYDAPRNPPNTGTTYTSGTDLLAHKARSGKVYFYTYHWSMWEGSQSGYELLTDEEAKKFLLEKAQGTGYNGLGNSGKERAEEYFPGIFDEDAQLIP